MGSESGGKGKHVGGRIREKAGEVLGDREMRRKGRLQQEEGAAEQTEAKSEDRAREARERKRKARVERELEDEV